MHDNSRKQKAIATLKLGGLADFVEIEEQHGEVVLKEFRYGSGKEYFCVPRGVTELADGCFSGTELRVIRVSSTVRKFGDLCFANCYNLQRVCIHRCHSKFIDKIKTSNNATVTFID